MGVGLEFIHQVEQGHMIFWSCQAPWTPDLLVEVTEQPGTEAAVISWGFSATPEK